MAKTSEVPRARVQRLPLWQPGGRRTFAVTSSPPQTKILLNWNVGSEIITMLKVKTFLVLLLPIKGTYPELGKVTRVLRAGGKYMCKLVEGF